MTGVFLLFVLQAFPRIYDPIIVRGHDLRPLLGVTVTSIRVVAGHNGALVPIPFQIDERTKKGENLFDMVKEGDTWRRVPRDKTRGILTSEDEIVFMAGDLGGRFPKERWPMRKGMEIEVADPLSGEKGYAYALSFTVPPPLSGTRYVNFDPEEKIILTDSFAMGFRDPARPGKVNFFAIGNALKDRKTLANILSAFRMKLHIALFFGKISLMRDESQVQSELTAYTNGPVRVLREIAYTMPLIGRIPSPKLFRVTVTYRHGSVYDNVLRIPFKPSLLITKADMTIAWDFTPVIRGSSLSVEDQKTPFAFDGLPRTAEFGFPAWAVLAGAYGGFLVRLNFDDKMFARVKKSFYIRQNKDEGGEMGWKVEGLEKLTRGRYSFSFRFYGIPGYRRGNEREILNIEDKPLHVTAR